MRSFWIASILLCAAVVSSAQVSTQYLDFGPLGLVEMTTRCSGNIYAIGVLDNYKESGSKDLSSFWSH